MTITLDVPPEKEAEIKAKAAASGQNLEEYALAALLPDPLVLSTPPYDPSAAIALLDAFANSDEYGTAAEQRETFEYLARVIDEDRPGQRSIFGTGYNPPADLNGWVEP